MYYICFACYAPYVCFVKSKLCISSILCVLCILCDVILCNVNVMYTYYLSGYPSHHVAMDLGRSSPKGASEGLCDLAVGRPMKGSIPERPMNGETMYLGNFVMTSLFDRNL